MHIFAHCCFNVKHLNSLAQIINELFFLASLRENKTSVRKVLFSTDLPVQT